MYTDRDRLLALLKGMEIENVELLMEQDPELFLALGKTIAERIRPKSFALLEPNQRN